MATKPWGMTWRQVEGSGFQTGRTMKVRRDRAREAISGRVPRNTVKGVRRPSGPMRARVGSAAAHDGGVVETGAPMLLVVHITHWAAL